MTSTLRSSMMVFATFVVAALAGSAARAEHDHRYDRLDRLATQLEAESRTLAVELRRTRSHDHSLRMAARDVSEIARDARHIHTLIHEGGSVNHLHRDVTALQASVHHLEEHLRPYSHFGAHVRRMDALTHAIDDFIHDLDDRHTVRRPVTTSRSDYGVPYNRGGATIGNRSFSIRLGR